jgi:hypothetical protein
MANFCGSCGHPASGAKFCANCGQALQAAEAPSLPPTPPPPPTSPVGAQQPSRQAAQQAAPSRPTPQQPAPGRPTGADIYGGGLARSPFTGTPVADYLRDATAVALLLASLALPWDATDDTSGRWWAVLSLLVALCAIPLPYLRASGVVPGLGAHHTRLLKLGLVVPLLASAIAALVNEFVNAADDSFARPSPDGGVGVGLSMALAGGLLAAVPRRSEEPLRAAGERAWWRTTVLLGWLALIIPIASTGAASILYLTDDFAEGADSSTRLWILASTIVAGLGSALLFGLPALLLAMRQVGYRRVVVVVGLTIFAMSVLALVGLDDGSASMWDLMYRPDPPTFYALLVEHWATPGAGLIVLGPVVALAWSRTAERATATPHPVSGWLATARAALVVTMLAQLTGLAATLVGNLFADNFDFESFRATSIILMVLQAVAFVVAAICLGLVRRAGTQRVALVVLCAALMLMGVVYAALVGSAETLDIFYPAHAAGFFALPALVIFAVVAPRPVREAFGAFLPDPPAGDVGYGDSGGYQTLASPGQDASWDPPVH